MPPWHILGPGTVTKRGAQEVHIGLPPLPGRRRDQTSCRHYEPGRATRTLEHADNALKEIDIALQVRR